MRQRPLTPSRSSSRTGSRRSEARLLLLLAAAGLCAAAPLAAQSVDLEVNARGAVIATTLHFRWPRTAELVESLRQGLESRITFTVRLYEQRRPALLFSRDRLLSQQVVSRSVFWDFLDGVFVVERDGDRQRTYPDDATLLEGLFGLDEVFPFSAGGMARRVLYVSARAQFEPVRLMQPLTLVGLVGAASTVATPWVRKDVQ